MSNAAFIIALSAADVRAIEAGPIHTSESEAHRDLTARLVVLAQHVVLRNGTPMQRAAIRLASNAQVCCAACGHAVGTVDLDSSTLLCEECYDYAGWENQHSDEAHSVDAPCPHCPICAEDAMQAAAASPADPWIVLSGLTRR